ncbi:hypothetical protein QFC21_004581 [Naganishia friedmannii]|uniref:Uncharacterized protein n=1 Tax=Naganishia friedmannii TaxID=89922 RepID=A0ACC2VI64_9TREE|nr:hypothetical protein QFC21_004581 [Naganishia friedmannii]
MNEDEEPRSSGEQLVSVIDYDQVFTLRMAGCFGEDRFASLQEECNYFRAQYESTVQKVEEIQAESQTLDDLIETLNGLNQSLEESNDALEQKQKEDEEDIQALEKRLRQLEDQLQDAKEELEVVKRKIENLEKEVDDRKQAIVKLELGNDDLERSQRNALSSILDLESKHNRLLEEKILLEEDLLGRERLEEELQRLRDELRDQTLETAYLKSQLEKKQEEIDKLRLETTKTQHETSTPAIHRISKSHSSASLSTPPTAVAAQRHMFMSPVAERSMEIDESPNSSSILTNSTIRANGAGVVVPVGSPSQIPVARLKRLSEVGAASSPGSPSLRRSNTVDSLSRNNNSPQQTRSSPLSPRYGAAAGNLNRSTNSRNIASLVLASSSATGSPAPPARYAAVQQRHASSSTSTSTPLRPLATPRKHSDSGTNSIYAAKRQEISSKTANLVARLQGISAAHKTVVRKTSGGFHRVANAISHHTHTGHGMLARSVSGQSDHADHQQQHGKGQEQGQQTGHDLPGVVLGDISTVSTNSPGSWVVVKDRSTMTTNGNSGGFIPLDQENKNVAAVSVNRADDPGAFLSVSVNRSLRSLPTRPGISSPLNQSVGSKPISTQERNAVVTARRNTRVHQATSNMTVASSSTSECNRSLASLDDGGMRVFSRPDSRLSGRDAESDDWVKSSGAGGDDHLPMIAPPPPSSRHRIDGVRPAGHRRVIEPPPPSTSRSNNVIEQSALPPRSSSVQGHHQAHASRPISSRRKTPPPGVAAAGSTSGTPGGSAIPRRSVSGRRPMSMSMVPQDVVPPLPVGALAHVEAGRRAAAIGMGLPSSSRR